MDKGQKEKRIKDLMIHLGTLRQLSPQKKAIDGVRVLDDEREGPVIPFVLVVDNVGHKEEIVGVLSLDDVLKRMESASQPTEELPIFWQGQFQEECMAVLDRPANEVMSPVTHVIHQSGTLTEAVHLMNSKNLDWLPVVEGDVVVGILLRQALLQEVFAVARG
jgi:CBS domain-containing protein